ncbi:MAG: YkgJ family cysteine cluster protein [Nitrospiraceae bacterium]
MRNLPIVRSQETRYARDSAFSYTCHACSRCCHDKIIHLNPYEVARLAQNRGIGTTEFLAQYTDAAGTALKRVAAGACVFLTAEGCGVHADRPLVCRIYPLGRHVTAQDDEWFSELAPHPHTEGTYGTAGTVEEYLHAQGAQPYIDAVDRYLDLLGKMAAVLRQRLGNNTGMRTEVEQAVDRLMTDHEASMPMWLDVDAVTTRYCAEQHLDVPTDPSIKMDVHMRAIEAWIEAVNFQPRRAP